jgi:hypothetical protein
MIEKPVPVDTILVKPATVDELVYPKFEVVKIMGKDVVILPQHQLDEYEENKKLLKYLNVWAKDAFKVYEKQVALHGDKDEIIGIMIDYNVEIDGYTKELEKQIKLRDTELVVDNVKHTVIETALGVLLVITLL